MSKQGKNGTWLDGYAYDFISDLMISNPVILSDSQQQQEIMLSTKDEMVNLQIENRSLRSKTEHHDEKKGFFARMFSK